jgi:uncharacterized membrane protein
MIPSEHIHPMLVHFPIVFVLMLAVFDIVAVIGKGGRDRPVGHREHFHHPCRSRRPVAVVTYYFGGVALDLAESHGFHSDIAETHEGLGELVAIAFVIWALIRALAWWRNIRLTGLAAAIVPVIEVVGSGLIIWTAYYGGILVYGLGVNVARAAGGG